MAERNKQVEERDVEAGLDGNLKRVDEDLDIMERHAEELDRVEDDIQESMRKWDREFKNASLHSVPKPRKHMR
ncbi:hypothetical protein [Desulfuromonas sp. TF]|uniref:hypothetical protein n=1 Tax=Desulfuromonas sp. TF TaxID=1232410 RepID=UPI00040FEB74|nr:hypothetical protein [Desulfuromonas sp. TF]